MFRPFTGQNAAEAKSCNGIQLGFSEFFRKFYATKEYTEVVIVLRRDNTHTYGGLKDSLEVLLPGRVLGTSHEDIL